MASTVLCRGIPLLCVPLAGGSEADKSGAVDEDATSVRVSVHQLSVELWQRFDTPRASVQRKIDDLKIRLYQCTRRQIQFLRDNGIIDSFRATTIRFQDAERVCDGLQRSRDKRGLAKHPLKVKGRRDKRRAEELWVLRMSAKKKLKQEMTDQVVVDECECALNGAPDRSPTPFVQAPPPRSGIIKASIQLEEDSDHDSTDSASLILDTLLIAEEGSRLDKEQEHKIAVIFREEFAAVSLNYYNSETVKNLDALDLSTDHSNKVMSALRPHHRSKSAKLPSYLQLSPIQHRRNLHLPSHPLQTFHTGYSQTSNSIPSPTPLDLIHKDVSLSAPRSRSGSSKRSLCSPEFISNEEEEEEEEEVIMGRRELKRSSSSVGSARQGDRFLFLSSEEEEEDVIFVKVERQGRRGNLKKQDRKDHSPHPRPCRRRVATKLRHFAHATSPNTAASSPGKQLPFGSSHSDTPTSQQQQHNNSLWVSISRSVLATPKLTKTPPTSQKSLPSKSTQIHSKKRSDASKSRQKPTTLSSFATLKRARSPSLPPMPCPAGKKPKLSKADVPSDNSLLSSLLKGEKVLTKNHSEINLSVNAPSSKIEAPLRSSSLSKLNKMAAKNCIISNETPSQNRLLSKQKLVTEKVNSSLMSDPPSVPPSKVAKVQRSEKMTTTTGNINKTHTLLNGPSKIGTNSIPPSIPKLVKMPHVTSRMSSGGSGKPLPLVNGVDASGASYWTGATSGVAIDDDRVSITSSSSLSFHDNSTGTGGRRTARSIQDGGGQRLSLGNVSTIKFDELFGYYPPKLMVQDGDLCPEYSLSVSGLDRSKLTGLPPSHPFWNWTLGQPTNKNSASNAKTSRRKQKSKHSSGT